MCMTFGYNPQINFCHFFHSLNLVNFGLNYKNNRWGHPCPMDSFSSLYNRMFSKYFCFDFLVGNLRETYEM